MWPWGCVPRASPCSTLIRSPPAFGLSPKRYGLKVEPEAYVWQLSVGEQQRVEIIKALYRGAGLIILDEPTAVLTPQEVNDLFVTLKRIVGEGHSLIFISHKLHEVMAVSDRVTVLRDGKVIGTRPDPRSDAG